ncbi:MAG: hypothetical protein KDI16_10680 [Halioglobus sp.]|nr:hypothetical protein [Halioglobus sp.]
MNLTKFATGIFFSMRDWAQPAFDALATRVDDREASIRADLGARLDSLESQIADMQASQGKSLADDYAGAWRVDSAYQRGSMVTHKGSLWLALADTSAAPASNSDWRLVSKNFVERRPR